MNRVGNSPTAQREPDSNLKERANRYVLTMTLLALMGCAARGSTVPPAVFSELSYRPFGMSGSATVIGNSFLISRGGDVKRSAGRVVLLIPDTDWLRYRLDGRVYDHATYARLTYSDEPRETIDKAWAYTKSTVADVDGKFTFRNVPAGKYLIETQLSFQDIHCVFIVCRPSGTDAILLKRISVSDGATVEVQLTVGDTAKR